MHWEIFSEEIFGYSAEIEAGKLKVLKKVKDKAFAVRVIENGRLGFSAGRDLDKTIEAARKIARISEEKIDEFPVEKPAKVEGLYDSRFKNLDGEFIKEEFERLLSAVEKAKIASAVISHEMVKVELRNSSGAELEELGTFSFFSIETVFNDGSGFAQTQSRKMELEIEETAIYAEELALKSAGAEKIESGYYDVILMPQAVHQLFSHTLYPSLSAENVARGRSRLYTGMELGKIRILDDATVPYGFASYSFDDEGVMARRKVLIDGKVVGFYSDWKNSKKFGLTGNGLRMNIDSPPVPMPSNIVIELDEKVDESGALVIHNIIGAHTANFISGDFSVETLNAEFKGKAVKGAMIYGNIFDLLGKVQGFLSNAIQIENTITPAIRFGEVRIV
uniref:TldD/PmbA family protein n=1 Tax=Archaeoglobus fulgidus TaxID=2234 RepID=A0A7J2TJD6_ARCFL